MQQVGVGVYYDGVVVGQFVTDLLVEEVVIVELKALRELDAAHSAQCLNYLAATGLGVCLLLNFGKARLEIKRLVRG